MQFVNDLINRQADLRDADNADAQANGPVTDETNIPPKSKVRLPETTKKLRKRHGK